MQADETTATRRSGKGSPSPFKRAVRAVLRSSLFQASAAALLHWILIFIYRTNRTAPGSQVIDAVLDEHRPVIIALWHGQQMLAHFARPPAVPVAGLVSRSFDGEITARVLVRAGNQVIRGSGGRNRKATSRKGGVAALLAMRDALRRGVNIVMIADISKGSARQSGEGIVMLARMSGCPIVPMAVATSRHYVVKGAWDRMTVNLPFGRKCLRFGAPIYVAPDADEAAIESARQRVTNELNDTTAIAYRCVGSRC